MAWKRLGAPPGAHQDPNSSTRSNGEPGMPEISCIANDADDLRPLRIGPISGVMLLRAWRERLSAVVWSKCPVTGGGDPMRERTPDLTGSITY